MVKRKVVRAVRKVKRINRSIINKNNIRVSVKPGLGALAAMPSHTTIVQAVPQEDHTHKLLEAIGRLQNNSGGVTLQGPVHHPRHSLVEHFPRSFGSPDIMSIVPPVSPSPLQPSDGGSAAKSMSVSSPMSSSSEGGVVFGQNVGNIVASRVPRTSIGIQTPPETASMPTQTSAITSEGESQTTENSLVPVPSTSPSPFTSQMMFDQAAAIHHPLAGTARESTFQQPAFNMPQSIPAIMDTVVPTTPLLLTNGSTPKNKHRTKEQASALLKGLAIRYRTQGDDAARRVVHGLQTGLRSGQEVPGIELDVVLNDLRDAAKKNSPLVVDERGSKIRSAQMTGRRKRQEIFDTNRGVGL